LLNTQQNNNSKSFTNPVSSNKATNQREDSQLKQTTTRVPKPPQVYLTAQRKKREAIVKFVNLKQKPNADPTPRMPLNTKTKYIPNQTSVEDGISEKITMLGRSNSILCDCN